jgi:hypothetical protein
VAALLRGKSTEYWRVILSAGLTVAFALEFFDQSSIFAAVAGDGESAVRVGFDDRLRLGAAIASARLAARRR